MKKGIIITALALIVLLIGGYLYLRYNILDAKDAPKGKTFVNADNPKTGTPAAKNDVDLRPALVKRLQELVKEGSDGLYLLSIDSLEPDVLAAKVTAHGIRLNVDTVAYRSLDKAGKLPDDVFKISVKALEIDGLGIADLLNRRKIDLKGIYLNGPTLEAYHKKRAYNEGKRQKAKEKTLYEKLSRGMERIAIDHIGIKGSKFIRHNLTTNSEATTLKDVNIAIDDILIDSSTQYDKQRVMFAKRATIVSNDYTLRTPDGLYLFRIGKLTVNAEQHNMIAKDVSLMPNGGRAAFEKRTKTKEVMFELNTPSVVVSDIDWWALMNGEQFLAGKADITGGSLLVYLNKTKPASQGKFENYPQQLLRRLKSPVDLKRAAFHQFDLIYEELNPVSGMKGTVTFNNLEIQMNNITNSDAVVAQNPRAIVTANGKMMRSVPMKMKFDFDLRKAAKGAFVVDMEMGHMDHTVVNPFSEPLGMVTVKTGHADKATAHVTGNNFGAKGKVMMQYTDLHIRRLKKDPEDAGELKKKKVTSLVANLVFIKDNNPSRGELRQPEFEVARTPNSNFFSIVWTGIMTGMLKCIGIPPKLGLKQ